MLYRDFVHQANMRIRCCRNEYSAIVIIIQMIEQELYKIKGHKLFDTIEIVTTPGYIVVRNKKSRDSRGCLLKFKIDKCTGGYDFRGAMRKGNMMPEREIYWELRFTNEVHKYMMQDICSIIEEKMRSKDADEDL